MGHLAARWKVTVPSVDVSFGRATEWFADFTDGTNRALRRLFHPADRHSCWCMRTPLDWILSD